MLTFKSDFCYIITHCDTKRDVECCELQDGPVNQAAAKLFFENRIAFGPRIRYQKSERLLS